MAFDLLEALKMLGGDEEFLEKAKRGEATKKDLDAQLKKLRTRMEEGDLKWMKDWSPELPELGLEDIDFGELFVAGESEKNEGREQPVKKKGTRKRKEVA